MKRHSNIPKVNKKKPGLKPRSAVQVFPITKDTHQIVSRPQAVLQVVRLEMSEETRLSLTTSVKSISTINNTVTAQDE